jgi:pectate lyase
MMKQAFFLFIFLSLFIVPSGAQPVSITESSGWLESAYIKWSPLADITGYNVYYKGEQDADYTKINDILIRKYAGYFRADVVGLKAGDYQLKIVPVVNDVENTALEAVSTAITVKAHWREGFAFSANSPATAKTSSGAYNDDGTLRAGAQVIYLTPSSAKTVPLNVVTSDKGTVTACTGIKEILAARQKGYDKTPLAIRVIGNVTAADMSGQLNSSGYIEVKGADAYTELNTTVEGIGDDATINGWGILVRQCQNIEIRNLGVMQFSDDGVSLDTDNRNIWVHNNDFFYGKNGGGDKDKGDGSLDSKKSGFVTISYNHFWDSGKCNLLGNGTENPEYLTYHHNWYDHSDSRHPRVRFHTVHVYNNYYDGNSKYGVGATQASNIFVENNYFRNCKSPMLISKQGTDIYNGSTGTFSSENGGMIKAYGNHIEGATRFVDQNAFPTAFDAIVVASRNETVPNTYKTLQGGTAYNNFDTNPSIMYSYAVQTPDDAKTSVMQYAGRINGGDLKFTFASAEDKNAEIIPTLETLVKNYKGAVLEIGGNVVGSGGEGGGGGSGGEGGGGGGSDACNKEYIPATDVNTDNSFTIGGSLSKNGGTQTYNGVSLTQGLKMDSKGSVAFTTTTNNAVLLVGVNSKSAGGALKLNGTERITNIGTTLTEATIELGEAGSYTIEKGTNENYIYYVVLTENCGATSIVPSVGKGALTLYPNPVTDNLYVVTESRVENVTVYNISGILVKRIQGNVRTVDMSNLSAGSYPVEIRTAEGSYKQKIIKK